MAGGRCDHRRGERLQTAHGEFPAPESRTAVRSLNVVYDASTEIRTSIVHATIITIVAFIPLFFLSGMEGRMLRPLGISFIVALFASMIVAVTLTPVHVQLPAYRRQGAA
ncbi:MAG: efflux RND transporter permease subunit [Alistipes indistinctus]